MASLEKPRYTPGQHLDREREASYKSEYLHGQIFAMAGASEEHNIILGNVLRDVSLQLCGHPCRTYGSDMRVQVAETGFYTYPDAVVVCGERTFADSRLDTLLNPSAIMEVLSPSTELYDREEKFAHYRRLPSLTDYVLVAQDQRRVEHYVRQGMQWVLTVLEGTAENLTLASAPCALPLAGIYENVDFA